MIRLAGFCIDKKDYHPKQIALSAAVICAVATATLLTLTATKVLPYSIFYAAIPGGLTLLFALEVILGNRSVPPKKVNIENPRAIDEQVATPPKKVNIQIGSGYPSMNVDRMEEVTKATKAHISSIDFPDQKLAQEVRYTPHPEAIDKQVATYETRGGRKRPCFLPPGAVVRTPCQLEYTLDYKRRHVPSGSHFFYVYHCPAVRATDPIVTNRYGCWDEDVYLNLMGSIFSNALETMIQDGCEHILTTYFGMGAFLRWLGRPRPGASPHAWECYRTQLKSVRTRLAQRFAAEFEALCHKYRDKNFSLYIVGPDGSSFQEPEKYEPEDNYNAFKEAFTNTSFVERVTLCPQADLLQKATVLARKYGTQESETEGSETEEDEAEARVVPVGVLNAADPKRLGNHWFNSSSAFRAVDENLHRRCHITAYFSEMVNQISGQLNGAPKIILPPGLESQRGTAEKAVSRLQEWLLMQEIE